MNSTLLIPKIYLHCRTVIKNIVKCDQKCLNIPKGIKSEHDDRQIVIYTRVSTPNQKVVNQAAFLRQFCNARGIIDQCIEEYGSGLNYNRKLWNKRLNGLIITTGRTG